MMGRNFFLLKISLLLAIVEFSLAANWAVLVAGSKGWYNYRHQADVCHAYQILHKHGIPDSNIIVMMYDDIARNLENPTKGVVINHPNGDDVYHGVPHDYTGLEVTPKNFMHVLLGEKALLNGAGSGKVLESGPDDNVFIYFTDHGATGLVAFPHGTLSAQELNETIWKMYTGQKYKQMVIYIEACESGSMLEGLLPSNINVYGTTASNAEESSYACYYDEKRKTYLGDVYSVVWMEDSDSEQIDKETLFQQFSITQQNTNTSHVMQYGNLSLGQTEMVGRFQGENSNFIKKIPLRKRNALLRRDAVPSENVRIEITRRLLLASNTNSAEKRTLQKKLDQLVQEKTLIEQRLRSIVFDVVKNEKQLETIVGERRKITNFSCYRSVTKRIGEKCFDVENEFVLNKLFFMSNLCEEIRDERKIFKSIEKFCVDRVHFDFSI